MTTDFYHHEDVLSELNRDIPLADKLRYVHQVLQERYPSIARVAVAIYDPQTDSLKTFVDSSGADRPLEHYQARLDEAEALKEILEKGRPRVVDDLDVFADGSAEHTRRIASQGYGSSYTMPMFLNGVFFGFVFFNAYGKRCFDPPTLHHLDVFGHLISLVIISEVTSIHTLLAALKTAREFTHQRDIETGAHLSRMAMYAQLIARELADKYSLDDDYIQHLFLFAPLHDIGKIGIPDTILRKPGTLTKTEFELMKGHVRKGREIIDRMLENFGLESFQYVDVLRNIAEYHHEAVNGSGYPDGLRGNDIPIEARIVAVADVFDALTSARPYKEAWTNDAAFHALDKLSGAQLDKECVRALERRRSEVEQIQSRFQEDQYD